jgi:hypothetical protein
MTITTFFIGSIIGFIYFLFELESPSMGHILFRFNDKGIKEFSFGSLLNMIQGPFKYSYFWTNYNFYSVNWVITSFIGGLITWGLITY